MSSRGTMMSRASFVGELEDVLTRVQLAVVEVAALVRAGEDQPDLLFRVRQLVLGAGVDAEQPQHPVAESRSSGPMAGIEDLVEKPSGSATQSAVRSARGSPAIWAPARRRRCAGR